MSKSQQYLFQANLFREIIRTLDLLEFKKCFEQLINQMNYQKYYVLTAKIFKNTLHKTGSFYIWK